MRQSSCKEVLLSQMNKTDTQIIDLTYFAFEATCKELQAKTQYGRFNSIRERPNVIYEHNLACSDNIQR